jgi:glutamate-1-semialdehyde 2,1-aminomutase
MIQDTGKERWKTAKHLIPGGTQLLSKQSEMFLPEQWPSYYSRAKGISLWGLDGTRYIDMSIMGVGACILGYADDDVNRAVHEAVDKGSMATLNCPEEVDLAELLLRLHPWAEMVRYAKTGGEAMAVAVRIARARTGKDTVAFCGYHGWHDWYLAANLADNKNLDGQLLPGLEPKGVPRGLKGTALPFNYNRLDELEQILERNDVGVIVMEPVRHHDPDIGFLQGVRKLANETGAVLVFDEITSGWRMNTGGVHALYKVIPDIAVYGKAMSNGYPMAAIVGKREVMESAQESFISSTYWTERTGLVASIATIDKCREKDVPDHLIAIGNRISEGWRKAADRYSLPVEVMGLPPLTTFRIDHPDSQALHTLFTQEMLKCGYLASKSVYTSYSHTGTDVEEYLANVELVFEILRKGIDAKTIPLLLKGPIANVGFKRLT